MIKKSYVFLLVILLVSALPMTQADAKKVTYRKVQKISFDGDQVEGVARNPYGAMLLQKRNMSFLPLYKVNRNFREKVKKSVDFLK